MTARILSGREVAAVVRDEVARRVAHLADAGYRVGLATVLVGDDAASRVYVRNKHRAAEAVGMASIDEHLPADATQEEVEELVARLSGDPRVDGIIVQLPLPGDLDGQRVVERIDPTKDADGLHPHSLGLLVLDRPGPRPATPAGVMRMLAYHGIELGGRRAVVVGRSFLVGRPMVLMLSAKGVDATVVQAHSRTPDLAGVCREADLLVVAAGRPRLVGPDAVKPGAVVVDVGINRTADGLVGDVDPAVADVAGALTPVPGGVGPMTIASLLATTVELAERRLAGLPKRDPAH